MEKESASKTHSLKKRAFYFYLDVKSQQHRMRLRTYLTKLGGIVSEFLDHKEVKYLITDRQEKDWPVKEKSANDQVTNPQGTPGKKVSDLLPRGKQFALAASAQPPPTSNVNNTNNNNTSIEQNIDVIELAKRRGIKVLAASNVLKCCLNQIIDKEKTNSRQSTNSTKSIAYFKGNFIKVEDMEEKYRPSAREFTEWPQIYVNGDPYVCPFIPPSKVKKTSSMGDINAARNNNNNNNQLPTNGTGGLTNLSSKIPNTPEIRMDTPKASTNRTNDLRGDLKQTPARKQDTLQYCEICGITFTNMNDHILSNTHQSHLNQEENFKDLRNVIQSLPKWTEDEEEIQNLPSDNSVCDLSYPAYPSLTPPTSSKTITLTPGSTTVKAIGNKTSAKGTFLPLHDYICTNNNSKNNSNHINAGLRVKYQNEGTVTSIYKSRRVNILGNSNNANANNIAANGSVHNSRNNHSFKIANLIYNNKDTSEKRKIVGGGTKLVDKFNFEQLFSDDDDDNTANDMVEASCFTPPLLPPLLYPELDIPEDNLTDQSIKDHFDVENGNYTDAEYEFDEQLFTSFAQDVSVEF